MCCTLDKDDYNTNGATHDPAKDGGGVANGAASDANIAKQRMCPPPDGVETGPGGAKMSQLRYGDEDYYITNLNREPGYDLVGGDKACFHNRTLRSALHFASVTDFYPALAHRHNWNDAEVNIPYLESPEDAWLQEKHPESFYQLCVAERNKKVLCCDGESVAPCQRLATGTCRYPGYSVNPAKAHCGTNAAGVDGEGCDCEECTGTDIAGETWQPRITPENNYNDYFFFKKVILNVRKQRLKPKPKP